jgi:hypothetical protein
MSDIDIPDVDNKTAGVKHIVVIIRARDTARVAEALRAALGLSLRGDRVTVIADSRASALVADPDPRITRARRTLLALGRRILHGDEHIAEPARAADAVEVWT